jgi:hypothetical protein
MSDLLAAVVLAGGLTLSAGATPQGTAPPGFGPLNSFASDDANSESHAIRGVVKSVSEHSLTITRASRRADVFTFVLNSATVRAGTIAIGVLVSVRYRQDGDARVATAVTAHEPLPPR